jgi:hypothetical protein
MLLKGSQALAASPIPTDAFPNKPHPFRPEPHTIALISQPEQLGEAMISDHNYVTRGRPNKVSTANVALGMALIPLLLIYRAKLDPMADVLWLFHSAEDISSVFWQGRMADALSLLLLTTLIYQCLRRAGIDRWLRPNHIVHALIGSAAALPALWSVLTLIGLSRSKLGHVYAALHYDRRLMLEPMLILCALAMILLVLANWFEASLSVRRRCVAAGPQQ